MVHPQPPSASGCFSAGAQNKPCDVLKRNKINLQKMDFSRSTDAPCVLMLEIGGGYTGRQGEGRGRVGEGEECHQHFGCRGKKKKKAPRREER